MVAILTDRQKIAATLDGAIEKLCRRYESGESAYLLAREYGCGIQTILKRLRRCGIRIRAYGGGAKNRKPGGALQWRKLGAFWYLRAYDRQGWKCYLHRACWETYNGPVPDGHDIHHINGDTTDNRIENLACVEHGAHRRIHATRPLSQHP